MGSSGETCPAPGNGLCPAWLCHCTAGAPVQSDGGCRFLSLPGEPRGHPQGTGSGAEPLASDSHMILSKVNSLSDCSHLLCKMGMQLLLSQTTVVMIK